MKIFLINIRFIAASLLLFLCLASFRSSDKTLGTDMPFLTKLQPTLIEFFLAKDLQNTETEISPIISIDNQLEIQEAMKEICAAKNPQPMKGAGWDKLVITCEDTVVTINTNSKNLGFHDSGSFYTMKSSNFITKRLKKMMWVH